MIYTLFFIAMFVAVLYWAFSKKRKARFDADARIPFENEADKR